MKLKVELASHELADFAKEFFLKHYGEEIVRAESNSYFDGDDFAEYVKNNYDSSRKTLRNTPINVTYENSLGVTKKIERERYDFIIKKFVLEKWGLEPETIHYGMIVYDRCLSQVEYPYTARCIQGIVIAECEIVQQEEKTVELEMV